VSVAIHYHARLRERSIREDTNFEDVSRKGAMPQREAKELTTKKMKDTKKKEVDLGYLLSLCALCVLCGDSLCALASLREIFRYFTFNLCQ